MGGTREKNMQKFIALCALCAFASALPSDFHNDVILGRRAAKGVTTPCGCFSTDCKVTAPTNGAMGDCKTTMNSGSTCTPTCNNGFTKVGTTSSCTNTALTKPTCQGKPCTGLTDAKVLPAGATKTVACAALVTATVMNSGTTCGFTCPANQVVDKTTNCEATVLTLGSCKASYCSGVDTYAKSSDISGPGAGDCGKTLALGGTCTPAAKTGYTCTGKVTCASTSSANTLAVKSENFACTANACTGITAAPTSGAANGCTTTLNSGSTCSPTCNAGYTLTGGVAGKRSCTAGKLTDVTCKLKTCDFSTVPTNGAVGDCTKTFGGGSATKSCTPTCKTGYTASGTRTCGVNGVTPAVGAAGNNFKCDANACTAASINAAVSTTTTASITWTGSTKPTGTIGGYTGTLNSGGSGALTCKSGYTVSKSLTCLAAAVTAGKCEQDCTTTLVKPSGGGVTFTGVGDTCTGQAGNKLKGGKSCTWGGTNAGNTCTTATCKDGTLTQSTCDKTTCDCTTAVANGAKGDCTSTQAQGSSCQKVCDSGYEANVNTKCQCSNVGVKTDTFSCKAKAKDTCTVTQTNGAKGTCNSDVGATTTADGKTCTTTCNAGYMTQTLKTTCSNGVATCNCHSSCAPGKCYTNAASQCTACKSDDYKLTANKDSKTFTTGTCTWKYTYTSPVSMTQKASFSITTAQFKGKETKFAKGYGASVGLTTAGNWKTGCKGSAAVVSRRSSIDINFSVTSTAALAAAAAKAATELTTATLTANLIAAGVSNALANALKSIGKVHINGASRTGVATLTAAVAMIAGLLWQ